MITRCGSGERQVDDEHAEGQEHSADRCGKEDERTKETRREIIRRGGEGRNFTESVDRNSDHYWRLKIGDRARASTPKSPDGVQRSGVQSAWKFA